MPRVQFFYVIGNHIPSFKENRWSFQTKGWQINQRIECKSGVKSGKWWGTEKDKWVTQLMSHACLSASPAQWCRPSHPSCDDEAQVSISGLTQNASLWWWCGNTPTTSTHRLTNSKQYVPKICFILFLSGTKIRRNLLKNKRVASESQYFQASTAVLPRKYFSTS